MLAVKLAACIIIPNTVVIIAFWKTEEFKFAWVYIKELLSKYKKRG